MGIDIPVKTKEEKIKEILEQTICKNCTTKPCDGTGERCEIYLILYEFVKNNVVRICETCPLKDVCDTTCYPVEIIIKKNLEDFKKGAINFKFKDFTQDKTIVEIKEGK